MLPLERNSQCCDTEVNHLDKLLTISGNSKHYPFDKPQPLKDSEDMLQEAWKDKFLNDNICLYTPSPSLRAV